MEKNPELEAFGKPTMERHHLSPQLEEDALQVIEGTFPTKFRATEAQLEELYEKGYNLYKSGHYKEALPHFKLLILGHPKEPRYVMALAATYHMLKDFTNAEFMYNCTSFLDPDNPVPQYHLADCCIHLNNSVGAYIALEMALTRCKRSIGHEALQERIEMLLTGMRQDFEEKKKEGFKYLVSDPKIEEQIRNYKGQEARADEKERAKKAKQPKK